MRTKNRIASTLLCCAALAIPIVAPANLGITAFAVDSPAVEDSDSAKDYGIFSLSGGELIAKKAGYYGIVLTDDTGSFYYSSEGIMMSAPTLDEAATAVVSSDSFAPFVEGDVFATLTSEASTVYVVFSPDGETAETILKVASEGTSSEEPTVATPQFRIRLNEEATAARTDGAAVYTVRAKMDYDKFSSWDDIEVPAEELNVLSSVSCSKAPDEEGYTAWASVEGFEEGTTYDEFEIYFFEDGMYTLYINDSAEGYAYLEFEVTEVSDDIIVEDPYEGIDLKAPELTISIPDDKNVAEGSVVQVKVTSNEPCVMLIGGETFGTIDNPVTEAVFEAAYNGRYTIVATDLDFNTAEKAFTVENFVTEDSTDASGESTGGKNPFNPNNRDEYWDTADLDNLSHGNGSGNNGSGVTKLPQTGDEVAPDKNGVNVPLVAGVASMGIAAVGGAFFAFRKKLFKRGGAK